MCPGQLIDWQVIFYGTDTPPQTSALTPSPPVRPTTSKPSNSWTDVKTLDRSKINSDFRDHMSDISGCKKTTETCLGWCLALVLLCTFYRNLALSSHIQISSKASQQSLRFDRESFNHAQFVSFSSATSSYIPLEISFTRKSRTTERYCFPKIRSITNTSNIPMLVKFQQLNFTKVLFVISELDFKRIFLKLKEEL